VARYEDHTVVATPAEAAVVLATAQRQHRLVYASAPRTWPADPSKVMFQLRLVAMPHLTARPTRPARRRRWGVLGLVAVGLAAAGGVLWLVITVVQFATANWQALLGAVVGLALALWFAAGRAGACPGIHCVGCKCG
jgi:ferric-dicitrate binding protein FerR (iron transport regulator)